MESKFLNDRYFVLHTMSVDRFGETFLAVDLGNSLQQRCAIEMSLNVTARLVTANDRVAGHSPIASRSLQHQFQHRIAVLQQLSSQWQQLPQIYAHFCTSDACYLVRELVTGTTLEQKVRHQGTLPPTEVKQISIALLHILAQLHSQNLAHHNLKPENILLRDRDNLPVLVGLGTVEGNGNADRVLSPEPDASDGATVQYSPKNFHAARDLYSLALIAVFLLTGKSESDLQIELETGTLLLPDLSSTPNLAAIIDRAINPQPHNYFKSAKEMLAALQGLPSELTEQKPSNSPTPATAADSDRHLTPKLSKSKLAIILSLLAIGGAIAIGWNLWRERRLSPAVTSLSEALPPAKLMRLPPPDADLNIDTTPQEQETTTTDTAIEIPLIVTGTQQSQLIAALGKPPSTAKGFWGNSDALIYKNVVDDTVDVSYLIDRSSGRLKQTEISIAQTLGLSVMQQALSGLLQGKTTASIEAGLQQVYQRQVDSYNFKVDRLEGTIKRIREENEDNVYIGIWEEDFH